ncbi:MMPL family transporter, partial [Mycobacterium intracellulare]|uniref:MMPL family transporter n=1 Tax=Mycobacterium intracellulare TaxID=1767 RepID=UPI00104200C8
DFLVIDKIAKALVHVHGIAQVQTITRPKGKPIEHTTIPYTISQNSVGQIMNNDYQQTTLANTLKQADDMQVSIDSMTKMQSITVQMADTMHSMVSKMKNMTVDVEQLRDHMADFDDFFRPLRSYFYWERHCFDIPACWALRSVFDALDGISIMSDDLQDIIPDMERLDALMPQMVAVMPPMIESMKHQKQMMLNQYQAQKAQQDQTMAMQHNATAMGDAFDAAKNDDSFYLPPDVFDNPDFKRGMKMFMSPDGKAVRMIITHQGDPASVEGIEHVRGLKGVVADALKGTPLSNAKVSLAGTASLYADMQDGVVTDLMIAIIAAMILIFAIMLLITRSVVAALVIVCTVAASLGTACGLSVLLWQDILGLGVQWIVIPLSMVILL